MRIILLSGGSGKRLWPLSNHIRSKQFIPVFQAEDGSHLSMVQRVYRQIQKVDKEACITVAAPLTQVSVLKSQLGENVDISVEPSRRDTFPAIALASAYLHDVQGIALNEVVAVCPVDPYVADDYYRCVQTMTALVEKGEEALLLMGIEPTYPSEKYGYIMPLSTDNVSKVKAFREKPTAEQATEYIAAGALWNSGVFAYRLGYVLEKAHECIDFIGYHDLYEKYDSLTKISFDYAVVEKEKNIGVVRYAGEWKDLGTWNTFTEVMPESCIGRVALGDNCRNTHVINELDIPILVTGTSNLVVVATPDGILVAEKGASSFIKPAVEKIADERGNGHV